MTQRATSGTDGSATGGTATDGPATGLTPAEVAERVARGEVNDIPVRSSRSTADIVRANVFTRFNLIIGVLWAITFFVAPIQDTLFGFVIIANTGIGIVQEMRAKRTLDGLAVIGEARPVVRRAGVAAALSTSDIVLGDLIELGPGDKVVVDGEVVEADGLEIDESLLTGEADPVLKHPGDPVMSGSFVVAGGGAFRATKVGRDAYAAQLAEEASRFTLVDSELRNGISTILKYVAWMMVPTAAGLIVSQLVVNRNNFKDSLARTIGGIVPMIPEGLVLLTSVAFAIGVVRLGRQQALVQELPAIEGLARVDVVCLDKTGTLTEGGMFVSELRPLGDADETYVRQVLGAIGASDPRPNASLQAIIDAYGGGGMRSGYGDGGTSSAYGDGGAPWRTTEALPFSSARKYSGAAFDEGGGATSGWLLGAPDVLLPEGDPALSEVDRLNERGLRVLLLARVAGGGGAGAGLEAGAGAAGTGAGGGVASWAAGSGRTPGVTAPGADDAAGSTAAGTGPGADHAPEVTAPGSDNAAGRTAPAPGTGTGADHRPEVTAPATDHPPGPTAPAPVPGAAPAPALAAPGVALGAEATALVVLEQRLRPDAADTLRYFADQRVSAKVISGDNAVSVGAVAAKLGLPGAEHTVDARQLPTDPDEMADAIEAGAVFGRVTPQQKRAMVGALQSRGHTVAMTGDGVNDVLALKDADIGVAMGAGSEATRAVAQIVLLDNSFATLPSVVAEGRRVIGNITRVATLFLTKTVYSVLIAILVACFQVEYPFLPRHLTLLSTLTIGVPAFFLALAPNKERARRHFVRRVMRYSAPSGVIAAAATFGTYMLARGHYSGPGSLQAETSAATLTLFLVSIWVLAIIARPYTWWRLLLVVSMVVAFLVVLAVPSLQHFFALKLVGTTLPWAAVAIAGAGAVLLEVAWRWVDRHFHQTVTAAVA
ncbi:HAD-IC family P-type ATPase [Streptomyces liangshanensis]|uniref:HAD-IC family P-type ATPase n=1 Tax=Streptomyces liangshanensis TaxID=2717324 RepID=A0A6G9H261_9ACTN|nr:HAD-IC family P-type ATPase [Streptomyces liangshanensis]QIQ04217.1 HAD-IC family P-type ATPase [Streptomyces liangshanensis]